MQDNPRIAITSDPNKNQGEIDSEKDIERESVTEPRQQEELQTVQGKSTLEKGEDPKNWSPRNNMKNKDLQM